MWKKLLDSLLRIGRRIGLLRAGAASWRGGARVRPTFGDARPTFGDESEVGTMMVDVRSLRPWIPTLCIAAIGLLLLAGSWVGSVFAFLTAALLAPPVSHEIAYRLHRTFTARQRVIVAAVGVALALLSLGFGQRSVQHVRTLAARTVETNEEHFHNYLTAMARMLASHRDAVLLERTSVELRFEETNEQEYHDLLALIDLKWTDVDLYADQLNWYADDCPETIAKPRPTSTSVLLPRALAYDPYDIGDPTENDWIDLKANDAKRWEEADLLYQSFPERGWLDAVMKAFHADAARAHERSTERNQDVQNAFVSNDAYMVERNKWATATQTGIKIGFYGAGLAGSIATGGALPAAMVFLGGLDVGVSVGETISVVWGNGEAPVALQLAREKLDPILFITGVQDILKRPKEWDTASALYLNDVFAWVDDPESSLYIHAGEGRDSLQIDATFGPPPVVRFASGEDSGNEYLPPQFRSLSADISEDVRASQLRTMKALLATPEMQQRIRERLQAEKDQIAKDAENAKLQAERDKKMAEIIKQKEAERAAAADAEAKRVAQAEAQRKLEELQRAEAAKLKSKPKPAPAPAPKPTPAPAPAPVPAPAPAPIDKCAGATACNACWCKGLACVCGATPDTCHCE